MPVTVRGVPEAIRIINTIAAEIRSGKLSQRAFERVAEPTKTMIDSLTPVRTGHLLSKNGYKITSPTEIHFFNDADYSKYVHDGTSRMQARPFIRDALRLLERQFPQMYTDGARQFIAQTIRQNRPAQS